MCDDANRMSFTFRNSFLGVNQQLGGEQMGAEFEVEGVLGV
jgi:hypothetical protein